MTRNMCVCVCVRARVAAFNTSERDKGRKIGYVLHSCFLLRDLC